MKSHFLQDSTTLVMPTVGIDLKELGEGSDVKMFEILHRD